VNDPGAEGAGWPRLIEWGRSHHGLRVAER
jgi:hypothetical protein